jgi:hypothetical protein
MLRTSDYKGLALLRTCCGLLQASVTGHVADVLRKGVCNSVVAALKTVTPLLANRQNGVMVTVTKMVTLTAPARASNALRQRRWRARQRNPAHAVYQVEFERDAVLQALINSGGLSANEIHDRGSVARALSGVIAEWVEHERRQHHP